MRIIIPMAGMGKRMRPHTLTVPKPLLPVAGKPMVQWIVEDLAKVCSEPVEEVAYIVGRFGSETESRLIQIAEFVGASGKMYYQDQALGTAHAVLCAAESLKGKVMVAFADTLFKAGFKTDNRYDGTIWVQKVKDPSSFGVVKVNSDNIITDFIEKPKAPVSDLAIIGIYYFGNGENLRKELQYLTDNNVVKSGEYQLTDALQNMKNKGVRFSAGTVDEWLDCGNKDATVYTNARMLELNKSQQFVSEKAKLVRSVIIPPCYIADNVIIENSVIGPSVSIGENTRISESIVRNSIIQSHSKLSNSNLSNSMIGNFAEYQGQSSDLSIGDFSVINERA